VVISFNFQFKSELVKFADKATDHIKAMDYFNNEQNCTAGEKYIPPHRRNQWPLNI